MEKQKISRRRPRFVDETELGHFMFQICGCTKSCNAREQLLFCSLKLLFGDVSRCRRRRGVQTERPEIPKEG